MSRGVCPDPAWIESNARRASSVQRLACMGVSSSSDKHKTSYVEMVFKKQADDEKTVIRNKSALVVRVKSLKNRMETCDPVGTPMEIKDKLDLDQNGSLSPSRDATKYRLSNEKHLIDGDMRDVRHLQVVIPVWSSILRRKVGRWSFK
ncbi:hypothetical protein Tco_0536295 [Tanacetum coccineum]